jgi:hypothetical protein
MKRQAEFALQKTKNLKPPVFDFGGHWRNELGSYMDLKVTRRITLLVSMSVPSVVKAAPHRLRTSKGR